LNMEDEGTKKRACVINMYQAKSYFSRED